MKKRMVQLLLIIATLHVAGCASIITGKFQKIPVTSEPPGARVRCDTGEYIITPGSFTLVRNEDHTLVAEFPGAEPQQKTVKHGLQGWFWGNILFGGIIGGVIDLASGSCDHLQPEKVHFDFTASGQQIAYQRATYIRQHSDIDEKYAFAIENNLITTGMTKEQIILSLGIPDEITLDGEQERLKYTKPKPVTLYLKNNKLIEIEDQNNSPIETTPKF